MLVVPPDWSSTELEWSFDSGIFFETVYLCLLWGTVHFLVVDTLVVSFEHCCASGLLEIHEELYMHSSFFTLF